LPGGTLNHFTKDLKIPQDIDEALQRLKKCKSKKIDIASVNDIYFINNSSIGLYPASLHDRQDIEQKTGKWLGAAIATLRTLLRFKTYQVTLDNATFITPFVFVGNNRYVLDPFGGTKRTSLEKGILTVYAAKTHSRFGLVKIAIFALMGNTKQLSELKEFHPKTLTIETQRSNLSVSHDGEVSKLTSPLTYVIHSRNLRILG
jgi:diacylglycerol kinase family enzyme